MRIYTWTDSDRRTSPTGIGATQELDHQLRVGSVDDSQKVLEYSISFCKRAREYTLTLKVMGNGVQAWVKGEDDLLWRPVGDGEGEGSRPLVDRPDSFY